MKQDLLPRNLLKSDETDGDEANSLSDSHYIVVELEDENGGSESDMDLDLFAPVESSESEEDELSDSLCVSWKRRNPREQDNRDDVEAREMPSSSRSLEQCRKRRPDVFTEQRRQQNPQCSAADRKMESIKRSMKNCIKCNMAFGVATKVCRACGVAQPMKRKLQKKIKKYDEAWANAQMKNGNLNNLFDETNLLLHKWQLLGMYPLFMLGGMRRSKVVAKCLCPIKFKHPQYKEAQNTMCQIFIGMINAQQTDPQPPVTKAPAQPQSSQLLLVQPMAAQTFATNSWGQRSVTQSPVAQILINQSQVHPPVTQSSVPEPPITPSPAHPPVIHSPATQQAASQLPTTQSLCSTPPTLNVNKGTTVDTTFAATATSNQLLEYQKLKSNERTNFSTGKKGNSKQEPKKVQINVGIMCLQNGCLKAQRGKTFSLSTDRQVTANDLLMMAETKFKDFHKDMEEGPFVLLYPDGSEVINVLGTQRPFTLKDYKSEIGKPYARINLFICKKNDFEEQILRSHSDTEVLIRTRNTDEFNLADPPLSDSEDNCPNTSGHVAKDEQCYREYLNVYAPGITVEDDTPKSDRFGKALLSRNEPSR